MQLKDYLLKWYDANARSLPWRGSRDPYRIWISEIMLQQTRAEAVVRYYERFLNAFPDVSALANAPEDAVLKLWEGLGYYSRARNLHKAAKRIAEAGGVFPDTTQGLERLPGVGPYAARAIGSIAFDIPEPALDGNQMRVLSRVLAEERILKTPFDLYDQALELLSRERPGDYNQALMDLGSCVCTAKNPKCAICPLASLCAAYAEGEAERYPLRPAPTLKKELDYSICLVCVGNALCIRKREERLLGGLYEFTSLEGHLSPVGIEQGLRALGFGNPKVFAPLGDAKHVFTHLVWRMKGYAVRADHMPDGFIAVSAETIGDYAFPSALRAYHESALDLLNHNQDCKYPKDMVK